MPASGSGEAILDILPADDDVTQPPPIGTSSTDEVLWWQGNQIEGLTARAGVIVLRPHFVAFIPAGEGKNLIGTLAGGLVDAAFPIQKIPLDWLRHRPNPLQMVHDLWMERPGDFDACLVEVVEHMGGLIWARSASEVARPGKGSARRSEALTFMRRGTELRGYAPGGPVLDQLLRGWRESTPSIYGDLLGLLMVSVLPLLLAGALFLGSLLTADIPLWAPLIGLGMAGLLYLVGGLKVLWLWSGQRKKP